MRIAILLELLGCTLGTHVSHVHSLPLASLVSAGGPGQQYHGIEGCSIPCITLPDPYQQEITALLANGSTQKFIAKRYGTTEGNLHHWLRKRGLKPVKV
ncbi:MAG TPA: hypothetical protein VI542_08375 [Candidatus Tectomicrobia bacterium]